MNHCRDCTHYVHEQGEESGTCYRFPPIASLMMMPSGSGKMIPSPVSIDVIVPAKRKACGEFVEKSRLITLN